MKKLLIVLAGIAAAIGLAKLMQKRSHEHPATEEKTPELKVA